LGIGNYGDICDRDPSVELDQVLKDQLTPAISARLHKQSTFRKPAKFDRRETEIFRKRTNLRCCAVIVARQEHDSPATMYGRILGKDRGTQMIEALDQSSASVLGMIVGPIAAAADAKLSGSRVVATDTSMPLRANALARAWPILPNPAIA
jgi:hypothetical protein